ncbi:hypothetical protein AZ468_10350 [Vibrio europaeus]|uniref:Uncharacterized protein n=1 Tax=Vibrio europaeus TaxID=300876 RepID=A0A178JCX4_9VIBR|nr:hypothetical protein AZ468_10350 [Vibrio europaeus]
MHNTITNFYAEFRVGFHQSVQWITDRKQIKARYERSQLQPMSDIQIRHDGNHDLPYFICYILTKIFYIN